MNFPYFFKKKCRINILDLNYLKIHMSKSYYSLGLMSGTSMDGVDASIIQSDGKTKYKAILDKYFEYPKSIYKNLTALRNKIKTSFDLKNYG